MDRKHSSDDNDHNSDDVSLESNETEDSNQYPRVTSSHIFEDPESETSDDEGKDSSESEEEEEHDLWSLLI